MAVFEIVTLGCKVNEYESRFYEEQLEKAGHHAKKDGESADVVIINTCTVTNTAAAKSRRKINRARRENPNTLIAVAGCYAQMAEEAERQGLPADLLIGAARKKDLIPLILEALEQKTQQANQEVLRQEKRTALDLTDQKAAAFESMPISHFEGQHRAFLKIQDGCNQYCSYCQIPYARGAERCADPEQILQTAKALADSGHLEIVLTGIHTGRYHSPDGSLDLAGLLERLLQQTPEQVAYRISSIEITEVSDALIHLMQANRRLLPHLHIPVQSASNTVLARMRRPYTIEQFAKRLEQIREAVPEVAVSTDVITGFVQESEEEFNETARNLEALGFSFLHVFPYSRRKGTAADRMTGFVSPETAKARTEVLLALSDRLRKADLQRRIDQGQVFEVLIERPDKSRNGYYSGYSREYHPVSVRCSREPHGRIQALAEMDQSVTEEGILLAQGVVEDETF